MTTDTQSRLHAPAARFERFARSVGRLLTGVLIATPVLFAVYAFGFSDQFARHPVMSDLWATPGPLPVAWRLAAFAVLLLASSPVLFALWNARQLFEGYARGEVFTQQAAGRLGNIAIGMFGAAAAGPIASVLMSLVLSGAGKASGITLSIGSQQLLFVVFGLVMFGIARVMRQAAEMAEDHAAIV